MHTHAHGLASSVGVTYLAPDGSGGHTDTHPSVESAAPANNVAGPHPILTCDSGRVNPKGHVSREHAAQTSSSSVPVYRYTFVVTVTVTEESYKQLK